MTTAWIAAMIIYDSISKTLSRLNFGKYINPPRWECIPPIIVVEAKT